MQKFLRYYGIQRAWKTSVKELVENEPILKVFIMWNYNKIWCF